MLRRNCLIYFNMIKCLENFGVLASLRDKIIFSEKTQKKVFHKKIGLNRLNLFFAIKRPLLIKNNDLRLFN